MCVAGLSMSEGHGDGHLSLGEGWGGGVRPPPGTVLLPVAVVWFRVVRFGSGGS